MFVHTWALLNTSSGADSVDVHAVTQMSFLCVQGKKKEKMVVRACTDDFGQAGVSLGSGVCDEGRGSDALSSGIHKGGSGPLPLSQSSTWNKRT